MKDIFIMTDCNEGMKAKLTRVAKGLRQIDVAAAAHVECMDITRLENNRFVLPARKKRILIFLGLLDSEAESDNNE